MTRKTPLILSHKSALAYWLLAPRVAEASACDAEEGWKVLGDTQGAVHLRKLREAVDAPCLTHLKRPIDLLTCSRSDRRTTSLATYHCIQTKLPDGALIHIPSNPENEQAEFELFVCSPELCFVQMACTLSVWELIELGFEMCGTYADLAHWTGIENDTTPVLEIDTADMKISSPEKIQAFAATCLGLTGGKRARQASKCLVSDSCSCEETHICMLASLPRSLGGMGTKRPYLNQRIAAPDIVARVLGTRTLTPDLYWPDAHVALEYDGRIWSNVRTRAEYENRKRNAYRIMGIDVVSMSRADLDDPNAVREQFSHINRKCGKRLKDPNGKQRARQDSLMNWIAAQKRSSVLTYQPESELSS